MNEIKTYNEQGFLVPYSMKSSAIYHAKIKPDGTYRFRIHDCITGIRLVGDLKDPEDVKEALKKLRCLASAAEKFAGFIEQNYVTKPNEDGKKQMEFRGNVHAYREIPSMLNTGVESAAAL